MRAESMTDRAAEPSVDEALELLAQQRALTQQVMQQLRECQQERNEMAERLLKQVADATRQAQESQKLAERAQDLAERFLDEREMVAEGLTLEDIHDLKHPERVLDDPEEE